MAAMMAVLPRPKHSQLIQRIPQNGVNSRRETIECSYTQTTQIVVMQLRKQKYCFEVLKQALLFLSSLFVPSRTSPNYQKYTDVAVCHFL